MEPTHSLCISIDFGTSRSGIAYSFVASPDKVLAHQQWPGAPASNLKTMTSLLLKAEPPYELIAFGDEAHQIYIDLEHRERDEFLYFEQFKMALFKGNRIQNKGNGEQVLSVFSSDGKTSLPASLVLSRALQYMKEFCFQLIRESASVSEEDVLFVITVPAIWDYSAKALVRQSASSAGLHNFILALEPEAAALACVREQAQIQQRLRDGLEYMVVDAGGGTIDIVAHRSLGVVVNSESALNNSSTGGIQELIPPSGGPWGSTVVDEGFITLLCQIFSNEFIQGFRNEFSGEWLLIMKSFEVAKLSFKQRRGDLTRKTFGIVLPITFLERIPLPVEFAEISQLVDERSSELYPVAGEEQEQHIRYQRGRLRISEHILHSLYKPVLNQLSHHISGLFSSHRSKLSNIELVFVVGGMASCSLLIECIQQFIPQSIRVISPQQPDLAVSIGAAIYGLSKHSICSRVIPQTFGMKVMRRFDPSIHPEDKRTVAPDGRVLCKDLFMQFIKKGASISVDEIIRKEVRSMKDLNVAKLEIYSSSSIESPEYVTEIGVEKLATLTIETEMGKAQSINVDMKFAETELFIQACNSQSGHELSSQIQFC